MSSFTPSGCVDIFSLATNINKLKTNADWRGWKQDIESLISIYDMKCWHILTGRVTRPAGPREEDMFNVDIMTTHLQTVYKTLEAIPETAYDLLDKALTEWHQVNDTGCMLLRVTLSPEANTMVCDTNDLREAFLILEKAYQRTSYMDTALLWDKATNLFYNKEDTAQGHLQRFQTAIQNLKSACPAMINNFVVLLMFISSIRLHPDMGPFTMHLTIDLKNITDTVLADVYSRFLFNDSNRLLHQNRRKPTNNTAAATAANKNKGRNRKRGKSRY
ncbi:hypothetical protein N7454_010577 [Penicillium verhagenii]|nr:hypothetical protein N7454_010577 [Penicillium verhagenii]